MRQKLSQNVNNNTVSLLVLIFDFSIAMLHYLWIIMYKYDKL